MSLAYLSIIYNECKHVKTSYNVINDSDTTKQVLFVRTTTA